MTTKEQIKKLFLDCMYELETKRFEIIHARDNKTSGFYECFARDEYLCKDLIFSDSTISGLYKKVKDYISEAGFSINLRITPEPIQYKY